MRWNLPDHNINGSLLEHLLRRRGITPETERVFLQPSLLDLTSHHKMHNAMLAAERIVAASKAGKKIFVHGDYDVDGVCATALMWEFLFRELKADILPYIPNRFDEGYGLSTTSLDTIKEQGGQMIITVDCGIKDIEKLQPYIDAGMEFVITDHHTLPAELPEVTESLVVVHPRYPQNEYPCPEVSGTTVAWKVVCAVNEVAGLNVDTYKYLDLVALSTICDVMPLVDENRVMLKHGLEYMRKTDRLGVKALLQKTGIEPHTLEPYHFGFVIGPRLNAAGRLDSAMDALRLLVTNTAEQAQELADKLHNLNTERQEMTQRLVSDAEELIAVYPAERRVIFVWGENWPEGIVGLVAGKLTEKYHRPVLIGSSNGVQIKASGRSIEGFHIANALKDLDHLLIRHGGHALAAGFTVATEHAAEFQISIAQAASDLSEEALEKQLHIDAVLTLADLSLEVVESLELLSPFGFGNPTPLIAIMGLTVKDKKSLGREGQHLKLVLADDAGRQIDVMNFNSMDTWKDISVGDVVDVAGTVSLNRWNGRITVQMVLKDLRAAEASQVE